jgi:hypothetical protein
MILDIAHLIDHRCIERYQNKYSSASVMMKDCSMQMSGPWPPYHFAHRVVRPVLTSTRSAVPVQQATA